MTNTDTGDRTGRLMIEPVEDARRLKAIEELQALVWSDDPRMIVPAHVLFLVGTTGGIVLAAYDGSDEPVGFVLGMLAREGNTLYHASHMLGIRPDYQSRGLGAQLKEAQRLQAIEQGLTRMTWTFDPLEARNAYFNLHKLGVTSTTYKPDVYGSMQDTLNRGLPSDRLLVEWNLLEKDRATTLETPTPILRNDDGRPTLNLDDSLKGEPVSLSVPYSIQQIKAHDPELAVAWRLAVRRAFVWAFERGYVARDFSHEAYTLTPI